jgi:hypothetical protein
MNAPPATGVARHLHGKLCHGTVAVELVDHFLHAVTPLDRWTGMIRTAYEYGSKAG